MGCFINQTIDCAPYDHDCSNVSEQRQLLWRLEDLKDALAKLTVKKKFYEDRSCFCEEDLRYVLPGHFKTTADTEAAIALAIRDLKERYGIVVQEKPAEEVPGMDEITGMQISFTEILATQAGAHLAKVA